MIIQKPFLNLKLNASYFLQIQTVTADAKTNKKYKNPEERSDVEEGSPGAVHSTTRPSSLGDKLTTSHHKVGQSRLWNL